jgi:fructose-1-phosphate kinase PfkB-like protein
VTPQIKVVNPIGSGDAFTAGLVSRLIRGDDLGEACRWGSATGAANTLTAMAGEVNRPDVERLAQATRVERIDAGPGCRPAQRTIDLPDAAATTPARRNRRRS